MLPYNTICIHILQILHNTKREPEEIAKLNTVTKFH